MKKILIFTLFIFFTFTQLFAQNTAGTSDDYGRIALTAYIDKSKTHIPNSAYNILQNKLNSIVSQNGLGSSQMQRFIITANSNLITKDITATAPPMHAYTIEVTFYIGDAVDGTLFSSYSVSAKGVGETEDKAYIAALKGVKTNGQEFKDFINEGKNKILEYYNSKCDFIIGNALAQASMENFDVALSQLINIPDVCKECYTKAQNNIQNVYLSKINKECAILLNQAKAAWMPRISGDMAQQAAIEASELLSQINPYSNCYSDALSLMQEIGKKMEEIDKREWEFTKKMEENRHQEELSAIKATKEIAVEQARNQPKISYNVVWW